MLWSTTTGRNDTVLVPRKLVATMKPDEALQEQIRRYQQMTEEQRLALALELHELSCNLAREGIRNQTPQADKAEVERLLRQRLQLASR